MSDQEAEQNQGDTSESAQEPLPQGTEAFVFLLLRDVLTPATLVEYASRACSISVFSGEADSLRAARAIAAEVTQMLEASASLEPPARATRMRNRLASATVDELEAELVRRRRLLRAAGCFALPAASDLEGASS